MKFNKYWFGKQLFGNIFGSFIPITWEGWLVTILEIVYSISLFIFPNFYFNYYGVPFAISAVIFVISYYWIGYKKQLPKEKGKVWPQEAR
jgi:hypothetical protein